LAESVFAHIERIGQVYMEEALKRSNLLKFLIVRIGEFSAFFILSLLANVQKEKASEPDSPVLRSLPMLRTAKHHNSFY